MTAARPDRLPVSPKPPGGAPSAPHADPFAELSAADQALVFDLVSVFLGDALSTAQPGSQEQDAA